MKMIKSLSEIFIKPVVQRYLLKERNYQYDGVKIKILPGVFHPGFFFSTKFLLRHLQQSDLKGKKLLELGAGSGLISFVSEKRGAIVTASEMSSIALNGLHFNKEKLHSHITIIESDLFENIPEQKFDFIIINPPYYPKKVLNESQLAWNCGEHHEFFEKLFMQLHRFASDTCRIIMVLSQDCDILTIGKIATANKLKLKENTRKKFWWEWNYIFEVQAIEEP